MGKTVGAAEAAEILDRSKTWVLAAGRLGLLRQIRLKPASFFREEVELFALKLNRETLLAINSYLKSKKVHPVGVTDKKN